MKTQNEIIRQLALVLFILFSLIGKSMAIGQSDSLALTYIPSDSTSIVDCYVSNSDGTYWIKVTSNSTKLLFQNPLPDINHSKIKEITLYTGTPGYLAQVTHLVYNSSRDTIINHSFEGLSANIDYYFKIKSFTINTNFSFSITKITQSQTWTENCIDEMCGPNLITNGDFENSLVVSGCTNFRRLSGGITTSLTPLCINPSSQDRYTIINNSTLLIPFGNITDHTTNAGNGYLFVGDCLKSFSATTIAWSQDNIAVTGNKEYVFEYFLRNVNGTNSTDFAGLEVIIEEYNGSNLVLNSSIGNNIADNPNWTKHRYCIQLQPQTTKVNIHIYCNGGPNLNGYDFGMDDMSFGLAKDQNVTVVSNACEGQPTIVNVVPNDPLLNYSWYSNFAGQQQLPLIGNCLNSNCSSFQFTPTSSGTYVVYSNTPYPYCSGSTTFSFPNFNTTKCCVSPNHLINSNTDITTLNINTGDVFFVNAGYTLTINNDITLTDCRMYFESGAKIDVAAGKVLTLNGCHLQGCKAMWGGITLISNAIINCNSSFIENALIAIKSNSTSGFSIVSSVFNKNLRDVEIFAANANLIYNGYVASSVFTCRYLPHPANLYTFANTLRNGSTTTNLNSFQKSDLVYYPTSTAPDKRSESGIRIYDAIGTTPATSNTYAITIGDATNNYATKGNLFDNHNYGIQTYASNIKIVNNTFQEMPGNDFSLFGMNYTKGIGVWVNNPITNNVTKFNTQIGGSYPNERNTFKDCGIGALISESANAIVSGNIITKTPGYGSSQNTQNYIGRLGIKFTTKQLSSYYCNSNTITNIYTGIEWSQTAPLVNFANFSLNKISTNSSYENCLNAITLKTVISYDIFPSYISVDRNEITSVDNGIELLNFNYVWDVSIMSNTINLRKKIAAPIQRGIYVLKVNNSYIAENIINSNSKFHTSITGIYNNSSISSIINCNTIYDLGNSIVFSGDCSPKFNANGILHNNTLSTYTTGVTILPNTKIGAQGTSTKASDNKWNNSGGPSYDIKNISAILPKPTFYVRNNNVPYYPINITPTPLSINVPTPSATSGSSGVTCSGSSTSNPPSSSLSNILTSEELDFMRKQAGNVINFQTLASEAKWLYANSSYEKLMKDSAFSPTDSIILNLKDSLYTTNIGKFYEVNVSMINGNWSQAQSENQAITQNNHIEENLKKYNSYYIAYHIDTTLLGDSAWLVNMIEDLGILANECYSTGGPAVPSARTMLSYFSNEIFLENEDCFKYPSDTLIADSSNSICDLIKEYSVPVTNGATYTWTVPAGTSYTQNGNIISVNWGPVITSGGTITCLIMDTLGNGSYTTYTEDSLITSPTCVNVNVINNGCVTATSLSWSSPAGCAAGYYLMLGTNGGGTSAPNNIIDTLDIGNITSYSLPTFLTPNTVHYFKVIPYNNHHEPLSGCIIGSFTSGNSVSFTPTLANPYYENFDGVTAPVLPCGITVSNENFPLDNFIWETESNVSCSGNNSIAISKNPNNSTTKDDWVYSHPLNLTSGELYRVKYKAKAESGFTESIESFVSESANAATMLTTASIINSSITSTNCVSDSGDFIAPASMVYFVGLHANSSAHQGTLGLDDLKVSLIKTTRLTVASCGDSLYTCDTLHCVPYTGATSYKFRFENINLSFSQDYTLTTANPKVYQFLGTNPLVLGHSYSVTVSAFVGGVWSPFGAACEVYVRPVPVRGLTGASCGGTLTDLSQLIYTNTTGICLINDYKYEFTDQSNNTVIETQRNSAVTSFLMTYITSPYVKYSTTYSVKVKLKIGNTWGEYGAACNVTTPASPLTKLANSYCNYTLPTFATPVNCVSVLGAQDYRYNIVGPNNYNRTFTRNSSLNNWYFSWTNSSPYLQANTTYDVKVASRAGGVWSDYGDVCTITTPATVYRMADTTLLGNKSEAIFETNGYNEEILALNVFPNPNSKDETFSIHLTGITQNNQSIKISIFNILGTCVYKSVINTLEESQLIISPELNLATGVYLIESDVNGNKLRMKFVVE